MDLPLVRWSNIPMTKWNCLWKIEEAENSYKYLDIFFKVVSVTSMRRVFTAVTYYKGDIGKKKT